MNAEMSRRRLMQLILAMSVSAAMHDKVVLAAVARCGSPIFGDLDLASIQELGREYLVTRTDDESIDAMVGVLTNHATEEEALAALRAKVLADFTDGRVVNLSGWFVSETEGRVFAALSRCDA